MNGCDETCKSYLRWKDLITNGRPRCEIHYGHLIPQAFQDFSQFVGCPSKGKDELGWREYRGCDMLCANFIYDQRCKAANKKKIPNAFMNYSRVVGCFPTKDFQKRTHEKDRDVR